MINASVVMEASATRKKQTRIACSLLRRDFPDFFIWCIFFLFMKIHFVLAGWGMNLLLRD